MLSRPSAFPRRRISRTMPLPIYYILDDRIESEGVQVGMPLEFLHEMWRRCNEARSQVMTRCGWRRISDHRVPPKPIFAS